MKLRRLSLNERNFNGYPLIPSVLSTDESRGRGGSSSVFFVLSVLPVAAANGGSSAIPMAFLISSSNEVREGM